MGDAALLDHPWLTRRKLDVAEHHRMGEAGILSEDDRVELVEGQLIQAEAISSAHAGTVNMLSHFFVLAAEGQALVSVQNPVRLGRWSELEPDLALLMVRADYYRAAHPTPADVLLLIEVADSSLRYDTEVKLRLYARHGIPEVWVVDLAHGVVEVHRDPAGDGYATLSREVAEASLAPHLLPGVVLRVADILG